MNGARLLFKAGRAHFVMGAVALATLTGCIGYVDGPRRGAYVSPAFVDVDDYVYYPSYEVYYSSSRHQYAYLDGGAWVARPAPRGVSVRVLLASPSVRMDFHDSPEHHHAAVAQQYPRNWSPRDARPGPPESRDGERGRGRGDDNRR